MNPDEEERRKRQSFWENVAYWVRIVESLFHISNAAVQIYNVYSETTTVKGFETPAPPAPAASAPPSFVPTDLSAGEDEKAEGGAEPKPMCVVCLDNAVKTLITPCNHAVLCLSCARRYQAAEERIQVCPLCKAPMSGIERLYFG